MKLVVISPERDDPRETAVLGELFAAGLERYHVRKPHATPAQLETWLRSLPRDWRPRLVLHQHHELVETLGLGGVHFRDAKGGAGSPSRPGFVLRTHDGGAGDGTQARSESEPHLHLSRSCHELADLRDALGRYDSVFFSPVFASISKQGHAPRADFPFAALGALLATRTPEQRHTTVLALGGITAETAPRALDFGFDGVAAIGAIWHSPEPVRAFTELRNSVHSPVGPALVAGPSRDAGDNHSGLPTSGNPARSSDRSALSARP